MNIHMNARLTPLRREEMARDVVEGRLSKAHAARTYGVTAKVVARWVLQKDAVLQGLVPALDLALRLRMARRAAGVIDVAIL
jgi:transposase-like protein